MQGCWGWQVLPDQPLMEAGLDSIGAVELRNAVGAKFGVDLPATVTFDHPTPQALTQLSWLGRCLRSATRADRLFRGRSPTPFTLRRTAMPWTQSIAQVLQRYPSVPSMVLPSSFNCIAHSMELSSWQMNHARMLTSQAGCSESLLLHQ